MCFNENCFCQNINYNKTNIMTHKYRVATVREKVWKMNFFPGQGKFRELEFESGKIAKSEKSQGISKFSQKGWSLAMYQCLKRI